MKARVSQFHCRDCNRMNRKAAYPGPLESYCVDCEQDTTHWRR